MFVGERNAGEETSLRGVSVPVVSVVAPAVADDDHLSSDRGRVGGFRLDYGSLEGQGAWW